jgi:hypothetical protein
MNGFAASPAIDHKARGAEIMITLPRSQTAGLGRSVYLEYI